MCSTRRTRSKAPYASTACPPTASALRPALLPSTRAACPCLPAADAPPAPRAACPCRCADANGVNSFFVRTDILTCQGLKPPPYEQVYTGMKTELHHKPEPRTERKARAHVERGVGHEAWASRRRVRWAWCVPVGGLVGGGAYFFTSTPLSPPSNHRSGSCWIRTSTRWAASTFPSEHATPPPAWRGASESLAVWRVQLLLAACSRHARSCSVNSFLPLVRTLPRFTRTLPQW